MFLKHKTNLLLFSTVSILAFLSFYPLNAFTQQSNNETKSIPGTIDLNIFKNDIIELKNNYSDPFFSFFFKASGGIVQLDNNVFYSSNLLSSNDPDLGFIQQVISLNGDLTNPLIDVKSVNRTELNGLRQLVLNSKFFDTDTFLSNGSSLLTYSLYIAIDDKSNTITWIDDKDVPNNLKKLVSYFLKTCHDYCKSQ
jgi:hypothetical protein